MKITMLHTTYVPGQPELLQGSVYSVDDALAHDLVNRGQAVPAEDKQPAPDKQKEIKK